ncbi:SufS family cysteine desulfurase [Thalassomonas actiniarum]|uniref:cysteine desulfurase n=1 Tax=Thalassomonas actiniarum TaxID=485447 RepID=A0AAE9YMG7_9GAMM|nr:SufS family cysteine desulfurase [Thalassomonas actiniarum]WDD97587.1 SufS family cysteine desulfurase [Thalassomonas actiniarum]
MSCFDPLKFRQQFPLLQKHVNEKPLIYFDNGATTQKPQCVLDAYQDYYKASNANVHRASHVLSARATRAFEEAREAVRTFINAASSKEIIWTKGTTEGINLIAGSWGESQLKAGDEIVLSYSEHHANIVPWQLVAEKTGAVIKILPLSNNGTLDESKLAEVITARTKVVACAHISNVIGRINPLEKIIARAKAVGAITVIDGAQAIAHLSVDVQALDCDFYLFSAHKMFGPTGVGVLYGRLALLEQMPPYQGGGEMIQTVSFAGTSFNELPFKFEAGTPNIAGVVAFAQAVRFLRTHQGQAFRDYEQKQITYMMHKLQNIHGIRFIVSEAPDIPVFSFTLRGHHNHDIATALDSRGIAIRSGHHCAMPLMEYLKLSGCLRLSLAPYNTFAEIDEVIEVLTAIVRGEEPGGEHKVASVGALTEEKAEGQADESKIMLAKFAAIKGWDSRHREIMLLGKTLERMDKAERNEQTLIAGCESLAWLNYRRDGEARYHFKADSDAKVIRGLLVIVLAAFNHKTAAEIAAFDIQGYFEQLGLLQHLSPSRGNGVQAIVKKIKQLASQD